MAQTLAKLKSDCDITEHSLQIIQQWAQDLLDECARTIIGGVKYYCTSEALSKEIEAVFQLGLRMANPSFDISSECQRRKLLFTFVVSSFRVCLFSP